MRERLYVDVVSIATLHIKPKEPKASYLHTKIIQFLLNVLKVFDICIRFCHDGFSGKVF